MAYARIAGSLLAVPFQHFCGVNASATEWASKWSLVDADSRSSPRRTALPLASAKNEHQASNSQHEVTDQEPRHKGWDKKSSLVS